MEIKNAKQHILEVAYHLRNAKSCLYDALSSVNNAENKQQIQDTYNVVEGALENTTTTLLNYKD